MDTSDPKHIPRGTTLLTKDRAYGKTFSICCLVTRWDEYAAVRKAFAECGFSEADCEFLVCDNSRGNEFSAYEAVREFLGRADGRYVLIVHQDAFPREPCGKLTTRIRELEEHDPMWGIIGNCGTLAESWQGWAASLETFVGTFPLGKPFERVVCVDENVLIVKNGTGITVSSDLDGFHFYGPDLCLVAERLGYTAYVVDYLWSHRSLGTLDETFVEGRRNLEEKLQRNYGRRSFRTTCSTISIDGSRWARLLALCRSTYQLDGTLDPHRILKDSLRLMKAEGAARSRLFPYLYPFFKTWQDAVLLPDLRSPSKFLRRLCEEVFRWRDMLAK